MEKSIEGKSRVAQKYDEYHIDYETCKREILKENRLILIDEPLAHIVMSSSLMIAFSLFIPCLAVKCGYMLGSSGISYDSVRAFIALLISIVLYSVFRYRAKHYSERRTELIFDCYIAKYGISKEKVHGDGKGPL